MKPITLIAAIVLIFVATFAFEYYANSQFEEAELVINDVLELETGVFHQFSYVKEELVVGFYTYSVVEQGDGYLLTSESEVSNEANTIELRAEYSFSDALEPEVYDLIAINDDEPTYIRSEITGDEIITYVTYQGVTLNITDDYLDGILFLEPNMPGFWELLFSSSTLEGGVKYRANIYVPQGAGIVPINLVVNREPQTVRVGEEMLSCTVIKEADLDLAFYLHKGELVQMRSDDLNLVFMKVR